jgi:RNA polymerase sigma-70 factor (ECF subfamily)
VARLDEHDPDAQLVQRVGRGDPRAIAEFVTRKLPRLMALATRMLGNANDAEDVAQEVFVRVWRHAGRWRPGKARFDTWMHRVALNLCYDHLRRRREIPTEEVPDRIDSDSVSGVFEPEADAGKQVARALQMLAPRQREAIVLTYYQELSNVDAAAVMNISIAALESLLARGRRALRTHLEERQDE